ncbi:MAG: tRNA pseudouridine(55) synthase TruB [Verrucomicrobia bacterium]|nr:tRNA pseudouridine(55) synthase TruB [Verrucomicrobiota bacterium]
MQTFDTFDGALLIDKPAGPTSHDIVAAIRRQFQIKKVGHCGTLDPNATGLLILLLGKATKLAEKLIADDKVYEGTIKFGETTDTLDAQGELTASLPVLPMSLEELNEAAAEFVGDHLQTPPMVSAIKKDGVPLYKLARKGIEVERKPRLIHIYQFRFSSYEEPVGRFRVACTKGTYVRVMAHDLGQKLGSGAHLKTLRRLESGRFKIDPAIEFEEVLNLSKTELEKRIIPYLKLTATTEIKRD